MDVTLALDLVRATYDQSYEAAIIVSQHWDFGPAVRLAKEIARVQDRAARLRVRLSDRSRQPFAEGVPGTTWIPIDQATYDICHDSRNYPPRRR